MPRCFWNKKKINLNENQKKTELKIWSQFAASFHSIKMKSFLIFLICHIKFCSATTFNNSYLIFVGSNYNDFRNLSINSSFSSLIGTNYFDLNKLTVLIVHGWRENYQDEITTTLVDAFLTRPEYNIVFADWSRYADIDDYIAATGAISGVSRGG